MLLGVFSTAKLVLSSGPSGVSMTNTFVVTSLVTIDALPDGSSYQPGSTKIKGSPASDYSTSGQNTAWNNVPNQENPNSYGIHTFIQDSMDAGHIKQHLDWSRALVGKGGYVKQLLYPITGSTTGPRQEWIDFVNAAYDRGLTPILRLQGPYDGTHHYWVKPEPDPDGSYTTIANAFKNVVIGLPRRECFNIYIEIWNGPELDREWSGVADPIEYGKFLLDTALAIHSLNDPRIKVLNGGMMPYNPTFLDTMLTEVPALLTANNGKPVFDYWAAHVWPQNHPPEYNYHSGPFYSDSTIDSYWLQLNILGKHGVDVGTPDNPGTVKVLESLHNKGQGGILCCVNISLEWRLPADDALCHPTPLPEGVSVYGWIGYPRV